jgi:DNA adenine methylase|tara:strand:- start:5045 stop:5890 length:846 start_codon:yes stop_codon:yes gene_type:complete
MLSYIGGKSRIGKWIVPFYPKDMETYVETFGGMFWCYYNMNIEEYPNLKNIVYNDFNPLNYNLFLCIQNATELLKSVESIPCQQRGVENTPKEYKELFKSFQTEIFDDNFVINYPDYDVAAKYAYILTQVFSGSKPETSSYIDLRGNYKSKYLTFRDKLKKDKWLKMFDKINHIENMDFQEVIEKYDGEKTYFYLDPPYWKTENYYSNHDFDSSDHKRLAEVLNKVKGKFSLSYYDFEILSEWFPKKDYSWQQKEFAKASAASKGKTQNKGTELLILNYNL